MIVLNEMLRGVVHYGAKDKIAFETWIGFFFYSGWNNSLLTYLCYQPQKYIFLI